QHHHQPPYLGALAGTDRDGQLPAPGWTGAVDLVPRLDPAGYPYRDRSSGDPSTVSWRHGHQLDLQGGVTVAVWQRQPRTALGAVCTARDRPLPPRCLRRWRGRGVSRRAVRRGGLRPWGRPPPHHHLGQFGGPPPPDHHFITGPVGGDVTRRREWGVRPERRQWPIRRGGGLRWVLRGSTARCSGRYVPRYVVRRRV